MRKVSRPLRLPRDACMAAVALALCWTAGGALAGAEIAWHATYQEALEAAQAQHKPLLLDFTAEWCGWCKKMDEEVYATPKVSAILKGFVCAKIDIDAHPEIALAYQVQSIPRTIILNGESRIISDRQGFYRAEEFAELLAEARDWKPGLESLPDAPIIGQAPEAAVVPETVDSPDAAAQLMKLLASQDASVRARAEEAVAKAIAQMTPALVNALSSGVLGERIAAIAMLRRHGHDIAPYDPWAPRAEREEAVKPWMAWLAQQPAAPSAAGEPEP